MNNLLQTAAAINSLDDKEKEFVVNEAKFALLGAFLFIILSFPWVDTLIRNVFPMGKGPIVFIYKVILFVLLYYIIQKTDWFQSL